MHQHTHQQLLRLPEVMRLTGMSRSWLYRAVSEGTFPTYHKVGRASVWDAGAVNTWILAQLAGTQAGEG
jgi:prophage regulatory protein